MSSSSSSITTTTTTASTSSTVPVSPTATRYASQGPANIPGNQIAAGNTSLPSSSSTTLTRTSSITPSASPRVKVGHDALTKGELIGMSIGATLAGIAIFGLISYYLIQRCRQKERSRFNTKSEKIRPHAPVPLQRRRSAFEDDFEVSFDDDAAVVMQYKK